MSHSLIVITGLIYAYIGGEQLFKNNVPVALMFFGYAFANIGIYLQAK